MARFTNVTIIIIINIILQANDSTRYSTIQRFNMTVDKAFDD